MNLTDEQEGRFLNCLSRYGVSITYGAQYSVRCQIGQIMNALKDFIAELEPSAPEMTMEQDYKAAEPPRRDHQPFGERYDMTYDQPAQIDCGVDDCGYYFGGSCQNVSPAITLNEDGSFVCWTKAAEPSAPEPSGVEWIEPMHEASDNIWCDDQSAPCIWQLQQVCDEQAERIAALQGCRSFFAKHFRKQNERIAAIEEARTKRLDMLERIFNSADKVTHERLDCLNWRINKMLRRIEVLEQRLEGGE